MPDARQRLARHFALDDVSTPTRIEAALLKRVPLGAPEAAIYEFLEKSAVGKDRLSSYHPPEQDPVIVCRIEFDPETFGFVKEHYGILFHLDGQKRLQSIEVRRWLTGL